MIKYILKMVILFSSMVLGSLALVGSFLAGGYFGITFAFLGMLSAFVTGIIVMDEIERK